MSLPKIGQKVRVDLDGVPVVTLNPYGVGYLSVVTEHLYDGDAFSIDVLGEALEDVPVHWTGTEWQADL